MIVRYVLTAVITSHLMLVTRAWPNGAPRSQCASMVPGHGASQNTGISPYTLDIGSVTTYTPGTPITVTVRGGDFAGMLLKVRQVGSNPSVGSFDAPATGSNFKLLDCGDRVGSAITHSSRTTKNQPVFTWNPPAGDQGDLQFIATVVKVFSEWWGNVTSTTLTYQASGSAGGGSQGCGFEGNDICNMVQSTNDVFDWTVQSGSTPSGDTGPSSAQGGSGYYLYMEASSPRQMGDIADISMPVLVSDPATLTFFYNMYGRHMGSLSVLATVGGSTPQIWFNSLSNSVGGNDVWTRVMLPLPAGTTSVIFRGTRGDGYASDIGLDSITIDGGAGPAPAPAPLTPAPPVPAPAPVPVPATPGPAPVPAPVPVPAPSPGLSQGCDFDGNTMCMMFQSNTDDFDWTLQQGPTVSGGTGPNADQSGSGYYIYTEASTPRQPGDYADISHRVTVGNMASMTFYYNMYGSDIGNLSVFATVNNVRTLIWNRTTENANNGVDVWSRQDLRLPMNTDLVTFRGIRGVAYRGDIAIDNINITGTSSGPGPAPTPAPTTMTMTTTTTNPVVDDYCTIFAPCRNGATCIPMGIGYSCNCRAGFGGANCQVDFCASAPCVNGGACVRLSGGYNCACLTGYSGRYCQIAMTTMPPTLPPRNVSGMSQGCDFDAGDVCNMFQSDSDNFDWVVMMGPTPSNDTGPSGDRTRNGFGSYMYIEASDMNRGDVAEISMPVTVSGQATLMFYYNMYGRDMGSLTVFAIDRNNMRSILYTRTQQNSVGNIDNWTRHTVTLPVGTILVTFRGVVGDGYMGDIGIDGINITGIADPMPAPGTYQMCDFDYIFMCMNQSNQDIFDWTMMSGKTPTKGTGPSRDQRGYGKYIYIETSDDRMPGDYADVSMRVTVSGMATLKFYYNMYGRDLGDLTVFATNDAGRQTLWINNQGNNVGNIDLWTPVELQLPARTNLVTFRATRGPGFLSDIAIDSIMIIGEGPGSTMPTPPTTFPTGGPVPGPMSQGCSFDNYTICNMIQSITDDFDWSLRNGTTPSTGTGPNQDRNGRGNYIFIEASNPRQDFDISEISMPIIIGGQRHLLSFYYHMLGQHIGSLYVFASVNNRDILLWNRTGEVGNVWMNQTVPLPPGTRSVVFQGIRGNGFAGDIALDDITIISLDTQPPVTFTTSTTPTTMTVPTTPSTTTILPSTPAPPLTPDPPPSGSSNSCDFDSGNICSMVQSMGDDFDWTLQSGETRSGETGPSADQSGNGQYIYIEASDPRQPGDIADISLAVTVSGQAVVDFYYNMRGRHIGSLVVLTTVNGVMSELWSKNDTNSDRGGNDHWTMQSLSLPLGTTRVTFRGVRGLDFAGDIGLDTITIRAGTAAPTTEAPTPSPPSTPAPPQTPAPPLTTAPPFPGPQGPNPVLFQMCDFDNNNICNMTQSMTDKMDWTLRSGSTPSTDTGPSSDQSGNGYYIYIEASGQAQDDYADITMDVIVDGIATLDFYYNIYGENIGNLTVLITINGLKFTRWTTNQENSMNGVDMWSRATMSLAPTTTAVTFRAFRGNDFRGDIAIDTIKITSDAADP